MATITVRMNTKEMCNICVDFIITHLKKNYGAKSVVNDRKAKQLKLVQKRSSYKIRNNINLHKPREMTAVLRVDGKISKSEVKKVLKLPGIKEVVMLDCKKTRKVRVVGRFAVHSLCEKLEKKPGVDVNVCSMNIKVGISSSSSNNSCFMNPSKMLTTIQNIVAK